MGAVQILTHSMVQSIEENSVRKGYDPRDFALVAEGGAGPAVRGADRARGRHAVRGRAALPGRSRPRWACSPPTWSTSTSRRRTSGSRSSTPPRCSGASRSSRSRRRAQLEEDGIPADRVVDPARSPTAATSARATSCGSTSPPGAIDDAWVEKVRADFHDIHEREYSRRFEDSDIEIPNIRVRGIGLMPPLETPELEHGDESPDAALRHEGEAWFRVDGDARAGRDALLRPRRAEGRQPARGPGDRQPVRLDHGDPARARRRTSTASGTSSSTSARRREAGRSQPCQADEEVSLMSRRSSTRSAGSPARPTRKRVEVDPITLRVLGGAFHAIAKEMAGVLFRMTLLVDHPRVRGPRRRDLRRRGPRALRVGLDADAHRLAALVHPRLPAPPRGRDRGRRRDHPQPPVPRRLAHARHRRRGADLPRGRAARLRRRDRARARRRRLVPRHQRGRVRRLRRGEDLQRPALVPGAAS